MTQLIFVIHILICFAIIGLVLVQQGKGADLGASLGGGSNSLFGAAGANLFLTKLTTAVAIAFFVTSIILVRAYSGMGFLGSQSGDSGLRGSVMEREAANQMQAESAPPAQAPSEPQAAKDAPAQGVKVDGAAPVAPPQAAEALAPVVPPQPQGEKSEPAVAK